MNADFLVIGGGIVGLNIACELKRRYADCSVLVLEKEPELAVHASGLNSGVLHAGFYYSADSLKARFCREGNALMRQHCEERGLRLNPCGKLIVAKNEGELAGLDELKRRGDANGVTLECVTEKEAKSIEPRVRTFERALFAPTTATVDPKEVTRSFGDVARELGVSVQLGSHYLGRSGGEILTSRGTIGAGYVVNAAGLYADRVGRDFGFSQSYRILPFKGIYLYSSEPPGAFRTNIYPVPELRNPFLGVHYTVAVDGRAKIGPTAIPCFWRENYEGIGRFRPDEFMETVSDELRLLMGAGFDFRRVAFEEGRKYWRPYLVAQAAELAEGVHLQDYREWRRPGIRAQLFHVPSRTLEMDYVLEGDERSMHVLNSVSPAFTSAIPFARYVCDQIAVTQGSTPRPMFRRGKGEPVAN